MTARGVNINFSELPDPRVIAWLEANGIDPATVPAAQEVLVSTDHMAYVEFIVDEQGKKIQGSYSYLKQIKTVPLISAPENFGL